MIRSYYLTPLLVVANLIGGGSAFLTPLTAKSRTRNNLRLLLATNDVEQSTSAAAAATVIDKESFQRSLLAAQLSNTKANNQKSSTAAKESNAHLLASLKEPVSQPAGHHVESKQTKMGMVHTLTVHLGQPGHPEPLIFETGRIGRQAAGAVLLTRGETSVYSTCGE